MKIAVFGDSFCHTISTDDNVDYKTYHWAHHLGKMLGAESIDFYGEAGSSFYYSFKKIIDLGHNYDKVICCVTSPNRFPVKLVNDIALNRSSWTPGVENIAKNFDEETKTYLKGWFMLSDQTYLDDVQESFITYLEHKFNNIIFVPCFSTSFVTSRHSRGSFFNSGKFNLHQYHAIFRKVIEIQDNTSWEIVGPTGMLCHIPTEWHPHVAETIFNHIKFGHDLHVKAFPISNKTKSNYFIY